MALECQSRSLRPKKVIQGHNEGPLLGLFGPFGGLFGPRKALLPCRGPFWAQQGLIGQKRLREALLCQKGPLGPFWPKMSSLGLHGPSKALFGPLWALKGLIWAYSYKIDIHIWISQWPRSIPATHILTNLFFMSTPFNILKKILTMIDLTVLI